MPEFISEIISNNYEPMMDWSRRRRTGARYQLINKIRHLLELLSGNNIVKMLQDVLRKSEKVQLNQKYHRALCEHAKLCLISKPKERYSFIRAIRIAGLSYKDAKKLGYNVSKELWTSCLNSDERNKGGRPALTQDLRSAINRHVESISAIAANR
jgi:hypothetical protein